MIIISGKSGFFPTDYVQIVSNVTSTPQSTPTVFQNSIPRPQLLDNSSSQFDQNIIAPSTTQQGIGSKTINPHPSQEICTATVIFDFPGTGPNEMPLKLGETIDVIKKGPPGGWSKGKLGAFPTDYVKFNSTATLIPAKNTSLDLLNDIIMPKPSGR